MFHAHLTKGTRLKRLPGSHVASCDTSLTVCFLDFTGSPAYHYWSLLWDCKMKIKPTVHFKTASFVFKFLFWSLQFYQLEKRLTFLDNTYMRQKTSNSSILKPIEVLRRNMLYVCIVSVLGSELISICTICLLWPH